MQKASAVKRRHATVPAARLIVVLGACAMAGGLAGCAQQKTLYNWQSYQPAVYSYLKDDGADYATQAAAMEKNIETARSANQALPPGFHAHLGMLYLKMGDGDKAVEQLQSEKLAFPEGTPFMDFLMRNTGKASALQSQGETQAATPAGRPAAPQQLSGKGAS